MRRTAKRLVIGSVVALALAWGSVGTAAANPVEDFCERSPRDGKAVWYRVVCE